MGTFSFQQVHSATRKEILSERPFWLSIGKEVEYWSAASSDQGMYEDARRAMYAMQLLSPVGGRNVYLKFRETEGGFDNVASLQPAEMKTTFIAKIAIVDEQQLESQFDPLLRGIDKVFNKKIVRLQNALLLLEHGLQTGHVYLSTLMWVMGLDMLFMAGKKKPFVERITAFLGEHLYVFPPFSTRMLTSPS